MEKTPNILPANVWNDCITPHLDEQSVCRLGSASSRFFKLTAPRRLAERERQWDIEGVKHVFAAAKVGEIKYNDDDKPDNTLYKTITLKDLLMTAVLLRWVDREGKVRWHKDTPLQLAHRMIAPILPKIIQSELDKIDPALIKKQLNAFQGNRSWDCFDEFNDAYTQALADPGNQELCSRVVGGAWEQVWRNLAWLMHCIHNADSGWQDGAEKIDYSFISDIRAVRKYVRRMYEKEASDDGRLILSYIPARGRGRHACLSRVRASINPYVVLSKGGLDRRKDQQIVADLKSKCISEAQAHPSP